MNLGCTTLQVQPFFSWLDPTEFGDAFYMTMLSLRKAQEQLAGGAKNEWRRVARKGLTGRSCCSNRGGMCSLMQAPKPFDVGGDGQGQAISA